MSNDLERIKESVLQKAGIHEKTIGGKTYKITLLPATSALAVATQLMKLALPSIGAFVDGMKKEEITLPEDNMVFTEVATLFVQQLGQVSILDLAGLLLSNVTRDGVDVDVDVEFRGNLGGLVTLLEFSLKENCGDFFTEYLKEKDIDLPALRSSLVTLGTSPSSSEQ